MSLDRPILSGMFLFPRELAGNRELSLASGLTHVIGVSDRISRGLPMLSRTGQITEQKWGAHYSYSVFIRHLLLFKDGELAQ